VKKVKKNDDLKLARELKGKNILITGGAGSIGSVLTKRILDFPVRTVRVLDIDEHALFKLKRKINDKRLRLLLGSILDKDRLELATHKAEVIIHVAAVKNIEITEYNPIETIETNINGTVNIIKTIIQSKPKIFINISTDKAADPSTLYGSTKRIGEKLTTWTANHVSPTKSGTVRFGNVMETRGNVFEVWEEEKKKKLPLSITHPSMKRYFFKIDEAIEFILFCLPLVKNGEIFIPKMKSYKVKELADKISSKQKIIGIREGEKMDEILISESEMNNATEKNNMWIIKQT
jgi:UDP-N-acetylglucosamine 4,6-dehydratase/5-epimerase